MMTFKEFLASQGRAEMPPAHMLHPTAAVGFASPGKEDTKRAIDKARKRGNFVTPDDLKRAISPESQQTAQQGVAGSLLLHRPGSLARWRGRKEPSIDRS